MSKFSADLAAGTMEDMQLEFDSPLSAPLPGEAVAVYVEGMGIFDMLIDSFSVEDDGMRYSLEVDTLVIKLDFQKMTGLVTRGTTPLSALFDVTDGLDVELRVGNNVALARLPVILLDGGSRVEY